MLSRETADAFRSATKDDPVFVKMDLFEYNPDRGQPGDTSMPHTVDVVAAITASRAQTEDLDEAYQAYILDGGKQVGVSPYREMTLGDVTFFQANKLDAEIVEPTAELKAKLSESFRMHDEAPFQIRGQLFADEPSYYGWDKRREFPMFEPLPDTEKVWTLEKGSKLADGSEVRSLDDAQKWILENHPDYFMGSSISEKCPSGDFSISARPCSEYPEGMYETPEGRRAYAEMRADDLGVQLGQEDAWAERRERLAARLLPSVPEDPGIERGVEYGG